MCVCVCVCVCVTMWLFGSEIFSWLLRLFLYWMFALVLIGETGLDSSPIRLSFCLCWVLAGHWTNWNGFCSGACFGGAFNQWETILDLLECWESGPKWSGVFTTLGILEDCNFTTLANCHVGLHVSIMGFILCCRLQLTGFEISGLGV